MSYSSQQLKTTLKWSKILHEVGLLTPNFCINHPAMLKACINGYLESVSALYEEGFRVVSQLGDTGWQFIREQLLVLLYPNFEELLLRK